MAEQHVIPAGVLWSDLADDETETPEHKDAYFLFKDQPEHPTLRYVNVFFSESERSALAAARELRWWHVFCPGKLQIFTAQGVEDASPEYEERARAAIPEHVWLRYVLGWAVKPKKKKAKKQRAHIPSNLFDLLPPS